MRRIKTYSMDARLFHTAQQTLADSRLSATQIRDGTIRYEKSFFDYVATGSTVDDAHKMALADALIGKREPGIFFTKGNGTHKENLTSFELALRDAGIAEYNLVRVSSIYPPNYKRLSVAEGKKRLEPGQVVYAVIAEQRSNEPHRLMAASVGYALPKDPSHYGYLSEHHGFGQDEEEAGDYAEDLAASMLGTILGIEIDTAKSYDERKEQWKIGGQIVRTGSVTQSAIGNKDGLWTTVLAAGVFVK